MSKFLFLISFLFSSLVFGQENTEVYVFDVRPAYQGLELFNIRNISNNPGYDSQPSFLSNEAVVWAGNNGGQNDISEYNLVSQLQKWVNPQTEGGEYSPQKFPSGNDVAAVRLDKDGRQRLYRYNAKTGNSSEIIPYVQVAYFAFYDDATILATVLNGDKMDLVLMDIPSQKVDTLFNDAGRSLQRVPNTHFMSYTLVNEQGYLDLYLMDMDSRESYFIAQLPSGVQDYVWINDTQVLVGSGSSLFMYDTLGESEWHKVASVEEYGIGKISRMAISPDGKKLALVAEKL